MQFRVLIFCEADLQQAVCWCNDRLQDDQVDLQKKGSGSVGIICLGIKK